MGLVVGIDGGGTKTVALCVDGDTVVGRGQSGPANYQVVGLKQATNSILTAVADATGSDLENVDAVWAGIAGVNTDSDRQIVTTALQHGMPTRFYVDNDAYNCLASVIDGPGVAVIAGTGSIAVGIDERGRRIRSGGWGYIAGDEGSGYDVGRKALACVCRAVDGRGPSTVLVADMLSELSLDTSDDLYDRLYGRTMSRHEIADLAKIVFRAARNGDMVARKLLWDAGCELALAAGSVVKSFCTDTVTVALCGGLFSAGNYVIIPLVRSVERIKRCRIVVSDSEPVFGAVKLAQRLVEDRWQNNELAGQI